MAEEQNLGPLTSTLQFDGGVLRIILHATPASQLTSFGTRPVTFVKGKNVGIDVNNNALIFTCNKVLNQGAGNLVRTGTASSILILDQTNTYTGTTDTSAITIGTITETSPGVFTVQVTPTSAGTLILQIPTTALLTDVASNALDNDPALLDDTTITVQTQYEAWAGGALFYDDANGDGVDNGLAFLLGASGPSGAVTQPTVTQSGGSLILSNFLSRNDANRGTATLYVEHSSDLGIGDPWVAVPVTDAGTPASGVTFSVTTANPNNTVTATISSSEAAGGKLFGRLNASPTP